MTFALDASVTATWCFPDERHPWAEAAKARLTVEAAIVPELWWFEIRNVLIINERRGRLNEGQSTEFLRLLTNLPIAIDPSPHDAAVLLLARRYRLSVYDAAYLDLARRHDGLASLDASLIAAARAEGVPVVGENL